ncbi:MAG: hypothetical protein OEZ65_16740, partial [Gemmatimonadota bacterium]|nr:hypothetical protein [Gemmatimonadota bacterium]
MSRCRSRRSYSEIATPVILSSMLALAGCGGGGEEAPVALDTPEVQAALAAIRPEGVEHHMRVLADDSLEGRAPGTRGFEMGSAYAEVTLAALGLEPAGVDGTYRQPVPLRESMVVEDA